MLGSMLVVPSALINRPYSSGGLDYDALERVGTVAADSQLKELKVNVNKNPSFETMNTNNWPESYSGYVTGYHHSDPAYTSTVYSGSYSGYMAAQSVPGSGNNQASLSQYFGLSPLPVLSPSIALDFYWNTLNNLDIDIGSYVYLLVETTNDTGDYHELRYYLSNSIFSIANATSRTCYMWNFTIGNWNHFSRNITADYDANPLIGPSDSTRRITYLRWYAATNTGCTNKLEFVLDDVSLSNGTYSNYGTNGDFETGDGLGWEHHDGTPVYVTQSDDSTDGSYSLNMTSGVVFEDGASASGAVMRSFSYPNGYYVNQPGDVLVRFDWKHNRTLGTINQYSTFRVTFENETGAYYCHFVLGYGADELIGISNSTNVLYFALEGFNVRDTWHHIELDLYDYLVEFGSLAGTIDQFQFYMDVANIGSQFNLLVDDFNIIASPTGDPGFEQDWYEDSDTPFAGWSKYYLYPNTEERTTDSFSGNYACNITPYSYSDVLAGVMRTILFEVSPNDFLDAWWRLDAIGNAYESVVYLMLELEGGYNLHYVFGRSTFFGYGNSSTNLYFAVDNFNTTGTWYNLNRNITADTEAGLSLAGDITIENIVIRARSGWGGDSSLLSLIIDDVIITDGAPPVVESIEQVTESPMYYDAVDIHVNAFDLRPGIDSITINYTTNGWTTWNLLTTSGTYDVTIPAQIYGTLVEYYVIALDGVGLETIDDNDGVYYSYVVSDDINPTVSIDSPEGLEFTEGTTGQSLNWNGTDLYPAQYSIYLDGIQIASGSWNSSDEIITVSLDGLAPGMYNYTCVLTDESGNWGSDSVMVTVNALTPVTTTTTTTSSTGGSENDTQLLILIGIGVGALLIIIIVCSRMRKK